MLGTRHNENRAGNPCSIFFVLIDTMKVEHELRGTSDATRKET